MYLHVPAMSYTLGWWGSDEILKMPHHPFINQQHLCPPPSRGQPEAMENMCSRNTVWEGPCPPPAYLLPGERTRTHPDVPCQDMLNE